LLGFIGILQIPTGDCLVVAHLVCGLVAWLGGFSVPAVSRSPSGRWRGSFAGMMGQTGISSRYWPYCSSGLRFSCRAWKPCRGSPMPCLALWRGGVVWLLCSGGWSAVQAGRPFQVVSCGDC